MGNRKRYAKFQENLFNGNEIISTFCPPLFRKRPIPYQMHKLDKGYILKLSFAWKTLLKMSQCTTKPTNDIVCHVQTLVCSARCTV